MEFKVEVHAMVWWDEEQDQASSSNIFSMK